MTSLHPCASCSRHILSTEIACPFCGAQLESPLPQRHVAPRGRLSRAALVALGTLAVSPVACGGAAEDSGTAGDGDNSGDGDLDGDGDISADGGSPQLVYGAPPAGGSPGSTGGAPSATGGARNDGGMGGEDSGTGGEDDMGTGGDQLIPVYGLAPRPDN